MNTGQTISNILKPKQNVHNPADDIVKYGLHSITWTNADPIYWRICQVRYQQYYIVQSHLISIIILFD